jgi:hypothetical protein
LILESEIIGDELKFPIAYWGLGQPNYCHQTLIFWLDYRNILYPSAKNCPLKWRETANRLLVCGETPEDVNQLE